MQRVTMNPQSPYRDGSRDLMHLDATYIRLLRHEHMLAFHSSLHDFLPVRL